MSNSITVVPLYDNSSMVNLAKNINLCELRSICTEGKNIENLMKLKEEKQIPTLKIIICFDKVPISTN